MTTPENLAHTVTLVTRSGACQTVSISEIITPEEIILENEAFRKAISSGQTTQEILKLGALYLWPKLTQDGEVVSLTHFRRELRAQILLLFSRGELEELGRDVRFEINRTLNYSDFFLAFLKENGLQEKVRLDSEILRGKIIFQGAIDDEVDIAERLGRALMNLPNTRRRVLSRREPLSFIQLDICERGLVGLLPFKTKPTVVKATNSDTETEVAIFAGERNLAPRVYEATSALIAEEAIVKAYPVIRFREHPEVVGRGMGIMLRKLHRAGIVYDNRFLDHVMVETGRNIRGQVRIIDLEAAGFSENFEVDLENAKREITRLYQDTPEQLQEALASFEVGYKEQ